MYLLGLKNIFNNQSIMYIDLADLVIKPFKIYIYIFIHS